MRGRFVELDDPFIFFILAHTVMVMEQANVYKRHSLEKGSSAPLSTCVERGGMRQRWAPLGAVDTQGTLSVPRGRSNFGFRSRTFNRVCVRVCICWTGICHGRAHDVANGIFEFAQQ